MAACRTTRSGPKSDIDLVLVTIDDKKVEKSDLALYADGVNVHAVLLPSGTIPQDDRRIDPQLVHALATGQRAVALYP